MYYLDLPLDGDLTQLAGLTGDPLRWAFVTGVCLLRVQRASLLLWDDAESALRVAVSVGIDPPTAEVIRVKPGEGIAGNALERDTILFGQAEDGSFVCIPVAGRTGVQGVLNLTYPAEGRTLTDDDIAAAKVLAEHLSQLLQWTVHGAVDPVSGLPNEQAFVETAERELIRAIRTGSTVTLALLQIDGSFTRPGGARDEVPRDAIRALVQSICRSSRRYDTLARYDENSLVLLLPHAESVNGALLSRLEESLSKTLTEVAKEVSVQVGLACCPADGVNLRDLVARARTRLQVLHPAGEDRH